MVVYLCFYICGSKQHKPFTVMYNNWMHKNDNKLFEWFEPSKMHFARQAGNALCLQEKANCNTRLSKIMRSELLNHYQHLTLDKMVLSEW